MALQVQSNVKIIKSGNIPVAWNGTTGLKEGEMAFGLITADNKYHLYGNSQGTVVDLIEASQSELQALDSVLAQGNSSTKSIVLIGTEYETLNNDATFSSDGLNFIKRHDGDSTIKIKNDIKIDGVGTGRSAVFSDTKASFVAGMATVEMSSDTGFTDNNKPVLSANPSRTIVDSDKATMRNAINVYAKTEVYTKEETDSVIDTKLSSVFKFKGTVETIADLPENAATGDTYQVTADGKLYAWDGDEWHNLSFVVDLSKYYTSEQVDVFLASINSTLEQHTTQIGTLTTDVADLKSRMTTVEGKQDKFATLEYPDDATTTLRMATGTERSTLKLATMANSDIKLVGLATPDTDNSAANKKYVDDSIADLTVELTIPEI